MSRDQIAYIVFGIVLLFALVFDLGLISKKNKKITVKRALWQTLFWVLLAMAFFGFLWVDEGHNAAFEYLSAYLMEWGLSIDNIFVFILIFNSYSVKEKYYSRVLLIGILMAIIFRVIFITIGIALVEKFDWVLWIFGAILVFTGIRLFITKEDDKEFNAEENKIYKILRKIFPLATHDGGGKFMIKENGKRIFTTLFVVVILLASIDILFALDSIPAVIGISRNSVVIYTSNIFAVLGLRSLFFLLQGAVDKFKYLQQGIAIVLVFIGIKMFLEKWLNEWMDKNMQVFLSLGVIVVCIFTSILRSIQQQRKHAAALK